MTDRLLESGWRPSWGERSDGGFDSSVVMAAAGTSDPGALRDLRVTAALLSAAIGRRVEMAYAATGEPRVDSCRRRSPGPWRAPGLRRVISFGRRAVSRSTAGLWRRRRDRASRHPSRGRAAHRKPVSPRPAACRRLSAEWRHGPRHRVGHLPVSARRHPGHAGAARRGTDPRAGGRDLLADLHQRVLLHLGTRCVHRRDLRDRHTPDRLQGQQGHRGHPAQSGGHPGVRRRVRSDVAARAAVR